MEFILTPEEQAAYDSMRIDPATDLQSKVDERINQWKQKQAIDLAAAIITLDPEMIDALADQVTAATEAKKRDVAQDVPAQEE